MSTERLVALLDQICTLPKDLEIPSSEESGEISPDKLERQAKQVAEESGKLIEVLSLLLWLETQRRTGVSGELRSVLAKLDEYRTSFSSPLAELLDRLARRRSSTITEESSEVETQQQWQQIELVQTALERLTTARDSL